LLAAIMLRLVVVYKGKYTIASSDAICIECGDIFAWPLWQTILILLGGIVAPLIQLSIVTWFCRRCIRQFSL
jgi:hypothetical protein